ncbi:MAG: biopolymer transporter ExbD [Methylocystis sp.]
MRKRPRHLSPGRQQPDISLNSFLDLVLNILLFFVFATELAVTKSLNVAIPKTEYGEQTSKDNESLLIQVTKDSRYFIGQDEIASDKLPLQMRERKAANPKLKSVIVRGDLESRLQATVDVLGACKQAGIAKVKIETEKGRADGSP